MERESHRGLVQGIIDKEHSRTKGRVYYDRQSRRGRAVLTGSEGSGIKEGDNLRDS